MSRDMAEARQEWPGSERAARFAALLAVLRAEQGMTRRQLVAAAPEVSYQTLSSIEQGVRWPTDASLTNLARALGLDLGSLIEARDHLAVSGDATSEGEVVEWLAHVGGALGRMVEIEPSAEVGFRSDLRWSASLSTDVYVTVVKSPDGSYRAVANAAEKNRETARVTTEDSEDRAPATHFGLEPETPRAIAGPSREPVRELRDSLSGALIGAAVVRSVGVGMIPTANAMTVNPRIAAIVRLLTDLEDDDLDQIEDFVKYRLSVRR